MNSALHATDDRAELHRFNRVAESKIIIAFVLALSIFTVGAYVSYQQTQRLIDADTKAMRTQKILTGLGDTYGAVSDLESAYRSFEITGDQQFLFRFDQALNEIAQSLQQLPDYLSENLDGSSSLSQLTAIIADRVKFAKHSIRLRQDHGYPAASNEVTTGVGSRLIEEIRRKVKQMERREELLSIKRDQDVKDDNQTMTASLLGLSIVAIGLVLLALKYTRVLWIGKKQSEEAALRQSNEAQDAKARLHATLMSMGDGLYQLDGEGRLSYMNAAGERMLGYALDEVRGLNMHEVIHSRDPAGVLKPASECPLLSVITKGIVHEEFDDYFVRKDGSFLPVHYVSSPLRVNGHVTGAVLSFRDTTERKQAEQAVRRSEQRFHAIFDHTFEFIGIMSPDGTLLEANETALAFEGIKAIDVIGRPFWETPWWTHSKELQQRLQEAVKKAAAGEFIRFEVEHLGPSGMITVDFSIKPVRDESGLVMMLIPEGRDITDKKRADERFRLVVEAAPSGMIMVDSAGKVVLVNSHAEQLFGYSRADLIGQKVDLLVAPETAKSHPWLLANFSGHPETPALGAGRDLFGRRRDGSLFPIEIGLNPLESEGSSFILASVVDISERKEVDKRVREFYAMISHELRTPLTSIRTSFGLLDSGKAGELSSKAVQLAKIGCAESDRLIRLINDILDFNKIESGNFELKQENCLPEELLTATIGGIKSTADKAHVSIIRNICCNQPIVCDADRIIQVLTNLIGNAIKFSESGSTVMIEVVKPNGEAIRFSVADKGPGIPASQIHKLFSKFQQLDGSDTRAKGGTGLGLAISKTIVEQHGGTIGVETKEGNGSIFWFELPCLPRASVIGKSVQSKQH